MKPGGRHFLEVPMTVLAVCLSVILLSAVIANFRSLSIIGEYISYIVIVALAILTLCIGIFIYRWATKPRVITPGPYGAYMHHKGKMHELKPLGGLQQQQQQGESVSLIRPTPVYYDTQEEYDEYEQPETPEAAAPTAELHEPSSEDDLYEQAKKAWPENKSRKKLADHLQISQHEAGKMITIMKERGDIK